MCGGEKYSMVEHLTKHSDSQRNIMHVDVAYNAVGTQPRVCDMI